MILFNLICQNQHVFEAWFSNSKEFNNQKRKKMIICPYCENNEIKKYLMAPNISKKSNSKSILTKKTMINKINKFKRVVEENFEYVGDKFTEEAKKIKYGEKNDRPIYGEATTEDTKELIEEDIPFEPLPWTSPKKSN